MKGQFFIIGALLISAMLFLGLPRIALLSGQDPDLTMISRNLRFEYPHALNLGINQSSVTGTMNNFTVFLHQRLLERRVNLTALWVVVRNQSSNDINVTAGNLLGHGETLYINLTPTPVKSIFVGDSSLNSTYFSDTGDIFNITVSLGQQSSTFEMPRTKAGLYVLYRLSRGENEIVNTVIG